MVSKSNLKRAFFRFKNLYYRAVQTDTNLGHKDYDYDHWDSLSKKAKQYWIDSDLAEREFLMLMEKLNDKNT